MAKNYRGIALRRSGKAVRGTCPVCGRSGVKTLWTITLEGEQLQVCKQCKGRGG
jgi:ribosome-binding protein aMBF1 (putative translation factor)